jgi:hypothetical protein
MNESVRNSIIAERSDSIEKAITEGTHFEAEVEPLFGGNSYYLFVYEVYKDVRLVGTPPSSIGKFGYDTDNWMWPRHTGDFSLFRIYMSPDSTPAEYSEKNIPLKPRYVLPISLKGLEKGDFTMVMGYPGSTARFMTSWEARELLEITNPNRIKIRGLRQEILLKDMLADEQINIQYASKYSASSNYWKYAIGENQGLKRLHVMDQMQRQEAEFARWVSSNDSLLSHYGEALDLIRKSVEGRSVYSHVQQYSYECFFSACELIAMAYKAKGLFNALISDYDVSYIDSLARALQNRWESFYKDYSALTDMKVIPEILSLYRENVKAEYLPDLYDLIDKKFGGHISRYVNNMFVKSIFTSRTRFEHFISHPTARALQSDPAFQAAQSVLRVYRKAYMAKSAFDEDLQRGRRLYIGGLMEMNAHRMYYPDANFTMRLTYGKVVDYNPRDAVHFNYYTTLEGIMEKEDPDNWEFQVSPTLKNLYTAKDYEPYGSEGKMQVCFITDNDITGGNSGSPVLDGEGNLAGIAFDGNWEAMSGDIIFEPSLQRCICVDIRSVLWIIDKYAGACHLINEMKILRE